MRKFFQEFLDFFRKGDMLRDPMDCSLPGSSIHGIFPGKRMEWVAIAFSDLRGWE